MMQRIPEVEPLALYEARRLLREHSEPDVFDHSALASDLREALAELVAWLDGWDNV